MGETLLVTGASGFLGARVLAAAVAAGRRAVAAVRPPAAAGAGIEVRAADLSVPGAADALCDAVRPDAVISCAALSAIGACERDPRLARAVNAAASGELATWCARRGARLVHVSTDLVFGGRPPQGERFAEEDPPAPLHVYGETKAAGEQAVLLACPSACVARLPLLFGDSGGRGRGASDALLSALARGERPVLFTDEWRTPLEVGAAALALLELARADHSGVLHVAGPERLSRYELGLRLLAAAGLAEPAARIAAGVRADLGLDAQRAADTSLDARRARSLLETPLRGPP